MELADIRKEYKLRTLELSDVQENPVLQLESWVKEAVEAQVNEPNAMTLSTVNSLGRPSSRVVLLKGIQEGKLVFFTNYDSQKGREIENFPHVALNFHWAELERQVRVEGFAEKISQRSPTLTSSPALSAARSGHGFRLKAGRFQTVPTWKPKSRNFVLNTRRTAFKGLPTGVDTLYLWSTWSFGKGVLLAYTTASPTPLMMKVKFGRSPD
ncbi:pyridoxamine 5'-phosphate oxidase [Nitritalea halalkaliphila LW7]|uniref:Pyridoxamine 5'-phosphate oxidase n=1 Tax=Nitritalea halalkaliphila LW7 TaxID=1189621 RepID=I5BUM1_9BACT|nr:pyridoxamine 5'-phosphate oxidase [Nitritalea halalkaliphila LW7]